MSNSLVLERVTMKCHVEKHFKFRVYSVASS